MPAGAQRQANLNVLLERAAGYGKSSYSGLFNFLRYIERLKKFDEDFAEGAASLDNENLVRIMSIHKSKGLEFPVVFLVDAVEGNMPHRKAVMDADIQEERRLFYVGMTRAKDKLYLYYAKERYGQELSCSRFIEELRGDGTPKPGQGEKRRQTI